MLKKLKSFLLAMVVGVACFTGASVALTSCGPSAEEAVTAPVEGSVDDVPNTVASALVGDDVGYMADLGMMKGHLSVAKELLEQGDFDGAVPHIEHLVETLYGDIAVSLEDRGIPQFDTQLDTLTELVKATPDDPQTMATYEAVMISIDGAIADIDPATATASRFVHSVLKEILETAEEGYASAIADGVFVEVFEYQSSRGFVMYANEFFQDVMPKLAKDNAEKHQTIADSLDALTAAWPSITPPDAPVLSVDEVEQLIAVINMTQV